VVGVASPPTGRPRRGRQPWFTTIVWAAALFATAYRDAALRAIDELFATMLAQL
jgi:hypothetical protein